jgi:hypothetical protein
MHKEREGNMTGDVEDAFEESPPPAWQQVTRTVTEWLESTVRYEALDALIERSSRLSDEDPPE